MIFNSGTIRLVTLVFLLIAVVAMGPAWGQQVTASFTGQITDPTGASVVGAKVTATDTERGTEYTATTNAEGYYRIQQVSVGTYSIKVEASGFQSMTQSNIVLQMNQIAKLDFKLQVGNVATTVEVTGIAPVLQTEATQLGQVIDARTNGSVSSWP